MVTLDPNDLAAARAAFDKIPEGDRAAMDKGRDVMEAAIRAALTKKKGSPAQNVRKDEKGNWICD